MKSPVSIFRGLALASLSVVSLFFACKIVKDHNKMATLRKRMQLKEINFALKEDQTIIGVIDTRKAMCFYIGNEMNDKGYE